MKIIILAGGKGTRLWPMSKSNFPKQFLSINGKSLFKKTLERCLLLEKKENIYISTSNDYSVFVEEELKDLKFKKENIIIEPFSRNTGPAILFALKKIETKKDELVLVCPSDHFIETNEEFVRTIKKAKKVASLNNIVTLGIKPTKPETGYGYIETKKSLLQKGEYFKVEKFIEKPNQAKAKKLIASKEYYWNSGIFVFPLKLMLAEFASKTDIDLNNFKNVESISIDKAVIEKSKNIATIIADFRWSDVGSWDSFYENQEKDKNNNVFIGENLSFDMKNSLVISNNRPIACFGLKDTFIIETKEVVFVGPKNRSQEVKLLVEDLEKKKQNNILEGSKNIRPWGSYTIVEEKENYKIKEIIVNPKKRISLQKHEYRSEHWVVIEGKAKVTLENKEYYLNKEESFFVPKQKKHRLENPFNKPLKIVEVQNGSYLGEDDIVRFDDDFGRID
ncbi:MAG: mannose-1-phosphate guanylyltransferase/mannose-6-phosphate isomerase [Candidatus Pacebacteria bacterium]|nr:mannose-1-phosphate guanylyltransferase/mannose-6-phosphate isomerase [Candidatus Paceibacterota bacterium]